MDEVEYLLPSSQALKEQRYDYLIRHGSGYLDIDDDFLYEVNEVYTGLYDEHSGLLYGSDSAFSIVAGMRFEDSRIQKLRADGIWYYVFDRKLSGNGLDDLWLRGMVSEEQGERQMSGMIRAAVILLPLWVVAASVGGYLIAGHALKPLQKISWTAKQISEGNDLKQRIDIGEGDDELHQLASTFDAVISAQCDYTLERERTTEEYMDALLVIRRQGQKMTKLINHMLDFARLEMRSGKYPDAFVDAAELVEAVCSDMKLIRERGITLEYETKTVMISVNPELFSRLLVNLVSNAYRYGRENGHIRVRLWQEDSSLVLSVADDGIGIARNEQEKIFRRFYQADASRGGEGTGLGLAMVYEIARFYHGTVTVESVVDQGSTFVVRMPAGQS